MMTNHPNHPVRQREAGQATAATHALRLATSASDAPSPASAGTRATCAPTRRRHWLAAALVLGLGAAGASWAPGALAASDYPNKPIRWVVGTAPGGGTDIVTRTVAAEIAKDLGQTIVVENRPGGGTTIAADFVARSPADGYTILSADMGTLVFNRALFKNLSYNPERDFMPLGLQADPPLFMAANQQSGFKSVDEVFAQAKAKPGSISFATAGIGSPHQLAMEMLLDKTGLDMVHVPYKGAAPAIQDVLGGHVPIMITDAASGMQMMKSGDLLPLAVFSANRHPLFPNVPTFIELGHTDVPMSAWIGMVVPKETPAPVVDTLRKSLAKALADPSVAERFNGLGLNVLQESSDQMARYMSANTNYWLDLIKRKDIRFD
ncbi:MAG: Bug family tripartite tricarboxylate transporter substrate binding protein [Pigmentiphaga sp.]